MNDENRDLATSKSKTPSTRSFRRSRLVNHNVVAIRGRTSMRLEPELWASLKEICKKENIALAEIVKMIEASNPEDGRTSAVRVFIVNYLRGVPTFLSNEDRNVIDHQPLIEHQDS